MESIVNVVQGDSLDATNKPCVFCSRASSKQLFGVTIGTKYNGTLMRLFPMCEEHLDKINALLSGEFDIDMIVLEKYRKSSATLRLRG